MRWLQAAPSNEFSPRAITLTEVVRPGADRAFPLPPFGEPNGALVHVLMTDSPNPLFLAAGKRPGHRKTVFAWSDVLRPLQRPEARERVLSRYRAAGFTPDDFARSAAARAHLADCLTRCEDWIELDHPRWTSDRAEIAAVRRVFEGEIR